MTTAKIPIQNIYFLLCYAWNKLDEKDIVDVEAIDSTNLFNLFAKVLINGTKHLLRRGLDRGYIDHSEDSKCLRGKIDFARTLKRNLLSKAMAYCQYDEYSHNILHNRIVKTTLKILYNSDSVDKELKKELLGLCRRLKGIDDIEINSSVFSRVVLNSNNAFYDFLLRICKLIYEQLMIDEITGKIMFRDFIQEDSKMAIMFEEFVRNFYKIETPQHKVRRENITWHVENPKDDDIKFLPRMITDVSIEKDGYKIVIDTKYYKEALTRNYDTEKINSGNLYQIMAYLKNLEAKGDINKGCAGILLYPTVNKNFSVTNILLGHKIKVATINLNQDWRMIHHDLIQVLEGM